MICPVCQTSILPADQKFMMANDNPYFNVYLHRSCWYGIKDRTLDFILANLTLLVDTYNNKKK